MGRGSDETAPLPVERKNPLAREIADTEEELKLESSEKGKSPDSLPDSLDLKMPLPEQKEEDPFLATPDVKKRIAELEILGFSDFREGSPGREALLLEGVVPSDYETVIRPSGQKILERQGKKFAFRVFQKSKALDKKGKEKTVIFEGFTPNEAAAKEATKRRIRKEIKDRTASLLEEEKLYLQEEKKRLGKITTDKDAARQNAEDLKGLEYDDIFIDSQEIAGDGVFLRRRPKKDDELPYLLRSSVYAIERETIGDFDIVSFYDRQDTYPPVPFGSIFRGWPDSIYQEPHLQMMIFYKNKPYAILETDADFTSAYHDNSQTTTEASVLLLEENGDWYSAERDWEISDDGKEAKEVIVWHESSPVPTLEKTQEIVNLAKKQAEQEVPLPQGPEESYLSAKITLLDRLKGKSNDIKRKDEEKFTDWKKEQKRRALALEDAKKRRRARQVEIVSDLTKKEIEPLRKPARKALMEKGKIYVEHALAREVLSELK